MSSNVEPPLDIVLITPPLFASDTFLMANPLLLSVLKKSNFKAEHFDLNVSFEKVVFKGIKTTKHFNPKAKTSPIFRKKIANYFLSEYLQKLPKAAYYCIAKKNKKELSFENVELFTPEIVTYHHLACNNFPKLIELLHDKLHNPFHFFYSKVNILKIIRQYRPIAIGFSIVSPSQLLSSLTLAAFLKKNFSGCHIVFGGPYLSNYQSEFAHNKQIYGLWDTLIVGEGETPLKILLQHLKKGRSSLPGSIPNLIHKQKNTFKPVFYKTISYENLDELPTPLYPNVKNCDPTTNFFIQFSRYCYWGKCKFCVHLSNTYPRYRVKDPKKVVSDIIHLQKRHNCNKFGFTDSALSPSAMRLISEQLILSGARIQLWCFCRLEKAFSYELFSLASKAGFVAINFGLETINPRLSNLICKGYCDYDQVERIIRDAYRAGMHISLHAIFGLPTEKECETTETYNFLKKRTTICTPIIEVFRLEKNTAIWNNPAKFGIEIMRNEKLEIFNNSFRYRNIDPHTISIKRALELRRQFYQEIKKIGTHSGKLNCESITLDSIPSIRKGVRLSKADFSFGGKAKKISVSRYIMTDDGRIVVLSENIFQILSLIDGKNNIRQIMKLLQKKFTVTIGRNNALLEIFKSFRDFFDFFNAKN